MGKVLSLFRRNPSSEEVLTKLESNIKDLEGYTVSTRETQRKFAGRFLVASIGTYVIAFVVFYFYFFPSTWKHRLLYSTPLLLFPVLIILLRYCVSWYFDSKIDRNNRKLIKLRNEKKSVLQNVMDKETYKVALDLLNTFGDRSLRLKANQPDLDTSTTTALNSSLVLNSTASQLRTPVRNTPANNRSGPLPTPSAPSNLGASMHVRGTPAPIGFRPGIQQAGTPNRQMPMPAPVSVNYGSSSIVKKTPFPVIDARKQNIMEKMMDFIISDGPSNRFAMICSSCYGHNGMALQEDFEYVAFKCAFCGTLNPARKVRPKARGLSPERKPSALMLNNQALGSSSSSEEEAIVKDPPINTLRAMEHKSESEEERDTTKSEDEDHDNAESNTNKPSADKEEATPELGEAAATTEPEPKDLAEKKMD